MMFLFLVFQAFHWLSSSSCPPEKKNVLIDLFQFIPFMDQEMPPGIRMPLWCPENVCRLHFSLSEDDSLMWAHDAYERLYIP